MENEDNNNKIPKHALKLSKKVYQKMKDPEWIRSFRRNALLGLGLLVIYSSNFHAADEYHKAQVEEARVGTITDGKYVYQNDDIRNLYYVNVQDAEGNITTHIIKKFNIDDSFSFGPLLSETTYLEHYMGVHYVYKEFPNFTGEDEAKIEIYIDAADETVVSLACNQYFPYKSLLEQLSDPYLSNDVKELMSESTEVYPNYGKITKAETLSDCLASLGIKKYVFTTDELAEMKKQLDNQQTINQKGVQKIKE